MDVLGFEISPRRHEEHEERDIVNTDYSYFTDFLKGGFWGFNVLFLNEWLRAVNNQQLPVISFGRVLFLIECRGDWGYKKESM